MIVPHCERELHEVDHIVGFSTMPHWGGGIVQAPLGGRGEYRLFSTFRRGNRGDNHGGREFGNSFSGSRWGVGLSLFCVGRFGLFVFVFGTLSTDGVGVGVEVSTQITFFYQW